MTQEWANFLEAIERAKKRLGVSKSGAWYRGVNRAKYRLYPTLLRPTLKRNTTLISRAVAQSQGALYLPKVVVQNASRKQAQIKKRELRIFEEFINFDEQPESGPGWSWERLTKLQHFGIPTRLLDWTEFLGCALFFALGEVEGPDSPAIWILNPFKLAQSARHSKDKRIGTFHLESSQEYCERFLGADGMTWQYKSPMPYRPPKLTPRIRAQRGFFTVHGSDCRPLDAIFPHLVRQVRLPSAAIPDARKFLELAGISSLSMFPDYEGLRREIRKNYE